MMTAYLACAALPAYAQGRAYVEMGRTIVKMTKLMVVEEDEVKAFKKLLKELDAADTSESLREFWMTARKVSDAMKREVEQGQENLKKETGDKETKVEELSDADTPDEDESPLAQRVQRMHMIVRETDGLRSPSGMADPSALARYRLLVGEFHDLLVDDVDAMKAEIKVYKEKQRALR